jgi:hypothetical protein
MTFNKYQRRALWTGIPIWIGAYFGLPYHTGGCTPTYWPTIMFYLTVIIGAAMLLYGNRKVR